MMMFDGLKVTLNENLSDKVWFRRPRTKRRRTIKKWKKDPRNWRRVPWDDVFRFGDMLLMHPSTFAKLKKELGGGSSIGRVGGYGF